MKLNYKLFTIALLLLQNVMVQASEGDTIGKSTHFVPRFSPNGNTTMVRDPEGGYVFGTGVKAPFQDQNGAPLGVISGVAQGYELNEPVKITHILALIPVLRTNSEVSTSKVVFSLSPIENGKGVEGASQTPVPGPGTAIASVEKTYQEITTNPGEYSVIALPDPVNVQSDFAIVCKFDDFIANSDSIGFLSDANGDGLSMKYTWRMVSITNFWDKWFTAMTWELNMNIGLLVVSENTTAIANPTGSSEISACLFPNPVQGQASLEFSTEKAQAWSLTWMDATGRLIKRENLGQQNAGTHRIQTDLSALSPGTYIYLLEAADGSKIAHSFLLAR